ncbi:Sortase family protein [Jatrophihabitans endophyticus]|uniref:Sortase family protein n=1 Tax=Jatrophihabitans endophyticus TaxID=1206085 RepID=A0A1M5UM78_9ACTN|nr:class F sortase [Jatrophihabitans endophyticus]SHH64094.1 Sortase family protein [Jatrophihabitans endophyticus]
MSQARAATGCVAAGLAAVVLAAGLALAGVGREVVTGRGAVAARDVGALPRPGRTAAHAPAVRRVPAPAADARLRLPRLGVDARIVGVGLRGSVMQVPGNPRVVGWWTAGAAPGAARGSAVIVGHVDYGGETGALAALPRARPDDRVVVTGRDGARRFRVVAVRTYAKTRGIPAAAFATDGPAQLVLVTCGGPFDPRSGNYEDNVVVYAVPGAA